ncbi:hypothetical protein RLOatenuis_0800 [Rickettsiales bacterium]|nr:hypothetical protein RLOatenuis_0800 [Rickettsiales bacterium]
MGTLEENIALLKGCSGSELKHIKSELERIIKLKPEILIDGLQNKSKTLMNECIDTGDVQQFLQNNLGNEDVFYTVAQPVQEGDLRHLVVFPPVPEKIPDKAVICFERHGHYVALIKLKDKMMFFNSNGQPIMEYERAAVKQMFSGYEVTEFVQPPSISYYGKEHMARQVQYDKDLWGSPWQFLLARLGFTIGPDSWSDIMQDIAQKCRKKWDSRLGTGRDKEAFAAELSVNIRELQRFMKSPALADHMNNLFVLEAARDSGDNSQELTEMILEQRKVIFKKLQKKSCFKAVQRAEQFLLANQGGQYAGTDCCLRNADRISHDNLHSVCDNLINSSNIIAELSGVDKEGKNPNIERILAPLKSAYARYNAAGNEDERARAKLCIELILGNRNRLDFANRGGLCFMAFVRDALPALKYKVKSQQGQDIDRLSDREVIEMYLSREPEILLREESAHVLSNALIAEEAPGSIAFGVRLKKEWPELHSYLTDYAERLEAVKKRYDYAKGDYEASPELAELKEEFNCVFGMNIFALLRNGHALDDEHCRVIINKLCDKRSDLIKQNNAVPAKQKFSCFKNPIQKDGINCGPWVLAAALAVLSPSVSDNEQNMLHQLNKSKGDDAIYTKLFTEFLQEKFCGAGQSIDNVPDKVRILMLCDQFKDVLTAQETSIEQVVRKCTNNAPSKVGTKERTEEPAVHAPELGPTKTTEDEPPLSIDEKLWTALLVVTAIVFSPLLLLAAPILLAVSAYGPSKHRELDHPHDTQEQGSIQNTHSKVASGQDRVKPAQIDSQKPLQPDVTHVDRLNNSRGNAKCDHTK